MKIVAINGSPKGSTSNTNVMVKAFLKGAQEAGAETVNILLSEKRIEHCKGCHTCWLRGPGQCVTQDDMLEVLSHAGGANVIVFATPVYFENISGMLKVFMDRMTMIGSPHAQKEQHEKVPDSNTPPAQSPKLMIMSSCGHADRDEFQVVSHWMRRVALKMGMDLIGEIYAVQGKLLTGPTEELKPALSDYLQLLEIAGKEITTDLQLSDTTKNSLEQNHFSS